jgi:hypothetical protein
MDHWPAPDWTWAYWLGAGYPSVILAKAYLASEGIAYQVASDEADGEWVILTHYEADGLSR